MYMGEIHAKNIFSLIKRQSFCSLEIYELSLINTWRQRSYRWTSHSMHLCAGLRRKYGQRRARKSEMLASSFLFTSLDWTLRSSVNDALLNSVSWNSRKAGSIPRSSSSPVQPVGGKGDGGYRKRLGMQPVMWQDCRWYAGSTHGIESAPVHGGSILRVKEKRSNLSAGQQGWVTLRQCKPLQLMGQWRHGNVACATSTYYSER